MEVTNATLLLTEQCNLRCKYCFVKHSDKVMTVDMSRKILDFLFTNALKVKDPNERKVMTMLFGGEPTLNPKVIEEVCEYGIKLSKRYKIQHDIVIITNATTMNDNLYNLLKKYVDITNMTIQLSVDGIPEVQDAYRVTRSGKPTSDIVFKNVPRYIELFKNKPQALSIHGCMNKETLGKLYESYKYFREILKFQMIWFIPVCEEAWDDNDVSVYRRECEKIYNHIMSIVKRDNSIEEVRYYAPFDKSLTLGGCGPNKPCGAGTNYCTVTADGELFPCHQIYFHDPEKQTQCGDIFSGADKDRQRLFLDYDKTDVTCPSDCEQKQCYRCIAVNYLVNGSPLSQVRGKYCEMQKIDYEFQKRMNEELGKMGLLDKNKNCNSNDACKCNVDASYNDCKCNVDSNYSEDACQCNVDVNCNQDIKIIRTWEEDGKNFTEYDDGKGVWIKEDSCVKTSEENVISDNIMPERSQPTQQQRSNIIADDPTEIFSFALKNIVERLIRIEAKLDNKGHSCQCK